eukprot:403365447
MNIPFDDMQFIKLNQNELYFGQIIIQGSQSMPCGYGILHDKSKNKLYEGFFNKQGQKHGKGRMYIIGGELQGNYYKGQFQNDKFQGQGFYRWPEGDTYRGSYSEGEWNGLGVYQSFDQNEGTSQIYFGSFQHGVRDGYGITVQSRQQRDSNTPQNFDKFEVLYMGQFKDDKSEGLGIIIQNKKLNQSQNTQLGTWQDGTKNGVALCIDKTSQKNEQYVAQYSNDFVTKKLFTISNDQIESKNQLFGQGKPPEIFGNLGLPQNLPSNFFSNIRGGNLEQSLIPQIRTQEQISQEEIQQKLDEQLQEAKID